MRKTRMWGLALTLSAQVGMCALHYVYVVYFLILGMFSVLAMIGEFLHGFRHALPLLLLLSYPLASIASIAVAWMLFLRDKKNLMPVVVSCYPVLHMGILLVSYGISA